MEAKCVCLAKSGAQGAKSDLTCYIKCDPNVGQQPVQQPAPRLNGQEVVSAGNSTQELAQISFVGLAPEGK